MYSEERYRELLSALPHEGAVRLVSILERLSRGFAQDLRTPLFGAIDRKEIIEIFKKVVGYTKFTELTEIDEHELTKVGPWSIMLPSDQLRADCEAYLRQTWKPDPTALEQAVLSVCALLPRSSLRPVGFTEAFSLMPKDTSLGLPYLTRDRSMAQSYLKRAESIEESTEIYPCVKFWRGQSKGLNENPKQRVVWGFDHAETILGATILYPALHALRVKRGFSSWLTPDDVDKEATELLSISRGRRIYSMDFSSYDSSLAREMLDLVDRVLKFWFVVAVHSRIDLLGEVSATVGLVLPYTVMEGRNGGMPSGSVLTNLKDTIANLIAGYYCAYRSRLVVDRFMVLGDDSVYLFSGEISPDEIAANMNELGLTCNPDKQFVSTRSLHFLQRWHSLDFQVDGLSRGVHSPYRTLSGMLGYERFRNDWNKYWDVVRWIEQIENCKWDPRFTKLCKFLLKGDKVLGAGMDPVKCFRAAGSVERIRSMLEIASFPFNQRDPAGVESFKAVQEIRHLQE